MLELKRDHVVGALWDQNPPAGRCQSGDTVVFCTRDCYDDAIVSETEPDLERQYANPATGPLYVEGAQAGDVLKVEILRIEVDKTGVMRTAPSAGQFQGIVTEREKRIFPIENGEILFDDKLRLKANPMIGVIGTTPEGGESVDTETPREHGGNMDCNRITEGATLYLPVNTDGALLAMGDLHALMGDGEVLICGMETRGRVTVRVTALKGARLPTPFLRDGGTVMTIQSAEDLDGASKLASVKMLEFVRQATGLPVNQAGMLLSLLGDQAICQVVDPLLTVRMEFPLDVLETYGYQLP